jgi:peptidoglycan lytic transglycosylase
VIGIRRANAYAVLGMLVSALAIPSLAWADSGGSSLSPTGGTTKSANAPGVQPGNITVTATSGGLTLNTIASALLRNRLSFAGMAPASDSGQTIEIERLGHETNWQWAPTVKTTVASNGSFSASWHTNHIGRFAIRAVISQASSANTASTAPMVTVTVYRQAIATQYGPGFYGSRTACGQKLGRNMIGLANRTLKCGEKVALYYRGRTLIVPVIDRGPYANGADWDLTEATGRVLGINGTAKIGAVSLPRQPSGTG